MVGSEAAADALGAPLKKASPTGIGSTARPLNALRWRFWRLGEPCAVRALREVLVEPPLLLAREPPVELLRHRELRALARDEVLELLREGAARAEEERLERRGREAEELGDLVVRPSLELAQHERLALRRRDPLEGAHELVELDVVVGRRVRDVLDELHLRRPGGRLAPPLPDDVLCDRDEPARRVARGVAALERAQGVHERRLGDVLRVGVVPEDRVRVAVDVTDVMPVEVVERSSGAGAGLSRRHSGPHDRGFSRVVHPPYRVLTSERASFSAAAHLRQ